MVGAFGIRSMGSGSGIRPIAIMCRSRRRYLWSNRERVGAGACLRRGFLMKNPSFLSSRLARGASKRIRRYADTSPPVDTLLLTLTQS
jgi:hypothetical protein